MDKDVRARVNKSLRNRANLEERFAAELKILSSMTEATSDMIRIRGCTRWRPCNRAQCIHCAARVPWDEPRPDPRRELMEDTERRTVADRNFRLRGGCWLTGSFIDLPESEVVPTTLNLMILHPDDNLKEEAARCRARLRKFFKKMMPHAKSKMVMEVSPVWLDQDMREYPEDSSSNLISENGDGLRPAYLLHAHGLIYAQGTARIQIGHMLRREYVGPNRVCLREVRPIVRGDDGKERGGIQGYAEYASMEKIKLDEFDPRTAETGYDLVDVYKEFYILNQKWSRNSRKIKIGFPNRKKK